MAPINRVTVMDWLSYSQQLCTDSYTATFLYSLNTKLLLFFGHKVHKLPGPACREAHGAVVLERARNVSIGDLVDPGGERMHVLVGDHGVFLARLAPAQQRAAGVNDKSFKDCNCRMGWLTLLK